MQLLVDVWIEIFEEIFVGKKNRGEISGHLDNPGWLFDIGDYTIQLYGDLRKGQDKDPYYANH